MRQSGDVDRTRDANKRWVMSHSLVRSEKAMEWFTRWDMAGPAGYLYPYGSGADLDVATDTMAFFFLFDDQFDGRATARSS